MGIAALNPSYLDGLATNEKTLEVQGLILVPEVGLEPTRF